MARHCSGVDVGSSSATFLAGEVRGSSFVVTRFGVAPNPTGRLSDGWSALASVAAPKRARVGITGRDVNVRYTRVPRLPDWQLRKLMRFEAEEIGDRSEAVASDFNVLPEIPEIEGEDVVLLALAREALLEEHRAGLAGAKGTLGAFTPNAIALYNAFLHYGVVADDTVLVANIGAQNIDVILVRGADLLFARNLTGGARLFDEAIGARFGIDLARAERYKIEEGTLNTNASFRDANAEKACRAMQAPAGQVLSLLQSTVSFCKNQVKLSSLKLERVLLCGGGAALDGLPAYISKGANVPVELFDPFVVVDTSKLDPASAQALEDHRLEAVIPLGLATSASNPEAYSIEILPRATRKRRDFLAGPAWLIAAAVLLVSYLGLSSWQRARELSGLREEARALTSRHRRAKRADADTRTLIDENRALEQHVTELFHLAGSGEQLVRTLAALESNLPRGFWVETLSSGWSWDEELGVLRAAEQPILRIEGRAREGIGAPTLAFNDFLDGLREDLPGVRVKPRMGGVASLFTLELTTLQPPGGAGPE